MKQKQALAILESGASVLITGAAGTGKTYLLREFIKRARRRGRSVAVTATTGLAATHLNGTTIHAWSGIGIADELHPKMISKMSKSRSDLIQKADVLIIDEISMLHDFRLDMIDQLARKIRGQEELPFGGLQVVLCGDFYQLPPVNRNDSRQGGFVTGSSVWQDQIFEVCYLKEQYRQADDELYTSILNGIRAGRMKQSELDSLKSRTTAVADPWASSTKLLTVNVDVDQMNEQELNKLDGDEMSYDMQTTGSKKYVENLKKSCLAQETLRLKKGAHVMFIRNDQSKKYSNGSLGQVIEFEDYTNYPVVKLRANGKTVTATPDTWELVDGDKKRASLTQIPLRLAWAITVHKSQGMTLDSAHIDLSKAFVEGMGYVALSRVRGIADLYLSGMNGLALRVSPEAMEIDQRLRKSSDSALKRFSDVINEWVEEIDEPEPKPASSWADKLAKMRKDYPNAYRPWKETEDAKLLDLFGAGEKTKDISNQLGRHPGSVRARLKKHLGDDVFDKQ